MEKITTTSSITKEDPELKGADETGVGAVESKDIYWSSDHVERRSSSPDAAAGAALQENNALFLPVDEERRLIRKMDFCIMPIVVLLYMMSFLDRVNIGMSPSNSSTAIYLLTQV